MPTIDYALADAALTAAANDVAQQVGNLRQAKTKITGAKNTLNGLPASYGAIANWIDAEVTANPLDEGLAELQRRKDAIAAAFVSRRTQAENMETALNSFDP